MASSGQVIEQLANTAGLLPNTVERSLMPLRADGLVPKGERGTRQERGQYEPQHLANVLLGFAGSQPSDAASSAKELGKLRHIRTLRAEEEIRKNGNTTLLDTLAGVIDDLGRLVYAAQEGSQPIKLSASQVPADIHLSLVPLRAYVIWRIHPDPPVVDHYFLPEKGITSPSGRYALIKQTLIDHELIITAANLWADSLIRRDEFARKSKGASPLPGEPAPSPTDDQFRRKTPNATGDTYTSETNASGGSVQPGSSVGPVIFSPTRPTRARGAR